MSTGVIATSVEPVINGESGLVAGVAEGPCWSESEQCLYWVDIVNPKLYRFSHETKHIEQQELSQAVSAVLLDQNNTLLVITRSGLARVDFNTGELTALIDTIDIGSGTRFNDAKIDKFGRLYAGTLCIDLSRDSGRLYQIYPDLKHNVVESGIRVANGLDWSPDAKTFYFVETYSETIYRYEFNQLTGGISNKHVFADFSRQQGKPDGITVDAEGYLWCAVWDGWRVSRYTPDGQLDISIPVPVPRPTSLAFGGPDRQTLYITTASAGLSETLLAKAPPSGHLLSCRVNVAGQPVNKFGEAKHV